MNDLGTLHMIRVIWDFVNLGQSGLIWSHLLIDNTISDHINRLRLYNKELPIVIGWRDCLQPSENFKQYWTSPRFTPVIKRRSQMRNYEQAAIYIYFQVSDANWAICDGFILVYNFVGLLSYSADKLLQVHLVLCTI